jgi:hypothetical protein
VALLVRGDLPASPAEGSLGSFSWDGLTSDGPWVVPSQGVDLPPGASLTVALEPAQVPASWTARWAPLASGQPGDVASADDGTGPMSFVAPGGAGPWGLQLEARFGEGRSAAWYWRVEVGP